MIHLEALFNNPLYFNMLRIGRVHDAGHREMRRSQVLIQSDR